MVKHGNAITGGFQQPDGARSRRRAGSQVGLSLALTLPILCGLLTSCIDSQSDDAADSSIEQGYVGAERCSICHGPFIPGKVHPTYGEDWANSVHGATTQVAPSETTIVADQNGNGRSDFLDELDLAGQPAWEQYTAKGGALGEFAPLLGFDVDSGQYLLTLGSMTYEIEQVLGVGRHLQSYLTRLGSSLYVLPVLYDVEAQEWNPLMPENWFTWDDDDGNDHIGSNETITGLLYSTAGDSPVTQNRTGDSWDRNCAGCHTTGVTAIDVNQTGEVVAAYSEIGVACEACHGPGRLHDAALGGQNLPNSGIVNPNKLSESQQRDLCMSCHTRGTGVGTVGGESVPFAWHPDGSPFLPGEVLADSFSPSSDRFEPLHDLQGGQTHEGLPGSIYGAWSQDCQHCHSAHDSTNLSRVRLQVPTPFSGPREVIFTARSGEPGSGGLMGDATDGTFTDACEVCHTRTQYFRNDASTPFTDHHNGQLCTDCHDHERGFQPDGGSCLDCHNRAQPPGVEDRRQVVENDSDGGGDFVRFSHHVTDGSLAELVTDGDCAVCHDQSGHRSHDDPLVLLNDPDGGASFLFDGTDASTEGFCLNCHDANGAGGNLAPFSSGGTPADIDVLWSAEPAHASTPVGVFCWSCHQNGHGSDNPTLGAALEEAGCLSCHDGLTAGVDVAADFEREFRHPIQDQSFVHSVDEDLLDMPRHVECDDCHNSHATDGAILGTPPAASGLLAGVSGMDGDGNAVFPVTNGYEVCYKCHADTTVATPAFPRTLDEANVRREFDPSQASFHPIETTGKNPDVPSLIGGWTTGSVMTCWDCHMGSSLGTHGSDFPWILKLRYDTADFTKESAQAYALCYSCHSRSSILDGDSFKDHKKHIDGEDTSCSACHDPHGVDAHGGNLSGSNLINFRTDIVLPNGNDDLFFRDDGKFKGACSLKCHGEGHNNEDY